MPTLSTPDGQPVEPTGNVTVLDKTQVDREFSRAMATEDPSGVQAPPRREEKTPDVAPRRRGRPRKDPDERARAAEKAPELPKAGAAVNYEEAAAGVVTLCWATAAGIPWTQAYAAVIDANAGDLTVALAAGARHNTGIASVLEKAATGGGGMWALQLASVGANMTLQTLELMRDPALRAEAAAHTRGKFRAFLRTQGIKLPDDPAPEAEQVPDDQPVAA